MEQRPGEHQSQSLPPAELVERVEGRIARCQARAQELVGILDHEARYLSERRLEGLNELLRQKKAQLHALEESEAKLRQSLEEAGYPPGVQGVRAFLRGAPSGLDEAWHALEEQLRAIQARNEANGRLIYRNLDHLQRLIDLATGAHERADQITYGTQGGYHASSRSRKITQA